MNRFDFDGDAEVEGYCQEIALQMRADFGISEEEAIVRINQLWKGLEIEGDDLVVHGDGAINAPSGRLKPDALTG